MHGGSKDAAEQELAIIFLLHGCKVDAMAKQGVHSHCHISGMGPVVVRVVSAVASLNEMEETAHLLGVNAHS